MFQSPYSSCVELDAISIVAVTLVLVIAFIVDFVVFDGMLFGSVKFTFSFLVTLLKVVVVPKLSLVMKLVVLMIISGLVPFVALTL